MPTTAAPVADRLTFAWEPSGIPEYPWAVTATEHRPRKPKTTYYLVAELPAQPGARRFEWRKHPDHEAPRADEVYTVTLRPGGVTHCDCLGAVCRRQGIVCRHALGVKAGFGKAFV